MKIPAGRLCVLAGLLLLQACALIDSLDSNLEQKIDTWVAQEEYGRALATLEYLRPSQQNYNALQLKKQKIITAARQFEQDKIRKANSHIDQQQWHAAEQTLDDALDKLPDSEALKIAWQNFLRQREQYLKNIRYQLTASEAERLLRDKPLQAELQRAIPADRAQQRDYSEYQEKTDEVRHTLLDCGLQAMQANELEQAERCFVLANELSPDTELQLTIQEIQKQLGKTSDGKILVLSDKGHAELALARQALNSGNLLLAKQHYQNIPARDKRHTLVTTFAQELNTRIESNVKQGIDVGRKLYSQGEIERALAVWNKLRELDPQNEHLLSHIERAERVMKKLKELRQLNQPAAGDSEKTSQ